MADNRLYIRHKPTGKLVYIGKYYVSTGWYTQQDDISRRLDLLYCQIGSHADSHPSNFELVDEDSWWVSIKPEDVIL